MNDVCVVIGASHVASQLAPAVRKNGWKGGIVVMGGEPCLPYHRPPLSRSYLAGEKGFHSILIKPQHAYEKADVHFRFGVRAESIDRETTMVRLDNGENIHCQNLVLATGARPCSIPLPGSDKAGVCYLRDLEDTDYIRRSNGHDKKAVIIGIGVPPNVELAETAGLKVKNGIVVDGYARTSDPDILAAGDCSWHYNPVYGRHIRLASAQNANEQANVAAATICGLADSGVSLKDLITN